MKTILPPNHPLCKVDFTRDTMTLPDGYTSCTTVHVKYACTIHLQVIAKADSITFHESLTCKYAARHFCQATWLLLLLGASSTCWSACALNSRSSRIKFGLRELEYWRVYGVFFGGTIISLLLFGLLISLWQGQTVKNLYGERTVSLQQLSATFRRGDLLEYISTIQPYG